MPAQWVGEIIGARFPVSPPLGGAGSLAWEEAMLLERDRGPILRAAAAVTVSATGGTGGGVRGLAARSGGKVVIGRISVVLPVGGGATRTIFGKSR